MLHIVYDIIMYILICQANQAQLNVEIREKNGVKAKKGLKLIEYFVINK